MLNRSSSGPGQWVTLLFLTSFGYLAGFNVGKVSATLPYIRSELDLSLVLAGSIASSYSLIAMCFAALLGIIVTRYGALGSVSASLAMVAVAGWAGAQAGDYTVLISSRVVEGIGYVLLAISIPVLIAKVMTEKQRPIAMGIWGTFLPGGVALSMFVAPIFENQWRPLWWFASIYAVVCLLALLVYVRPFINRIPQDKQSAASVEAALYSSVFARDPLLLAASFMIYSMFFVTLVTYLPTVLSESSSLSVKHAITISAYVVLCNIAGNLTGGWLMGRGVVLKVILSVALVGAGILSALVFVEEFPLWLRISGGLLACYVGGMLPAAVFASIASFVPAKKGGLLLGVVFQALGCGQVAGPIALATVVEKTGSWQYGAAYFLCIAVAGSVVLLNFQTRKSFD